MGVEAAYSIEPVRPDDAKGLATTMMSAFYQELHWRSLWHGKPLDEIIHDTANRIPWNLVTNGPLRRYQKVVAKDSGEVVGYARWILPEDLENCWPAARVPEVDEDTQKEYERRYRSVLDADGIRGLDHQMAQELSAAIDESEERVKKDNGGRFLILDYLAVHPDHQRQGIGGMLLRSGLSVADENHLKVLVNARTQGMELYGRNGFHKVDEVVQERPQYGWTEPQVTAVLLRFVQSN
ncbi:hypothetical protein PRZ48_010315 [Zasmidium cellare]|uniref:N-acetyltransferase domain-containing protein n=1 Tax=Zasmidium cellare TaxID=395010 RepID=A0ABR0E895_ZASCE|nr:hypothetical protein PRZ48_010315 [Zasmidium cellare]